MSLKSKVVKGAAWSATGDWGAQLVSLAVFILLARLLTPEDFGLIALAGVYIAFVNVFIDPGFSQALIQRDKLEAGHLDTAFWINASVSVALALASIAIAPYLANIFDEPELTGIILALSPVFLLSALSTTQHAILSREFRFKSLSVRRLAATTCGGVTGIGAAMSGFGVWSLVTQQLVSALVGVIVLWWASDWRPGASVSRRYVNDLFSFGVNVLGVRCLSFLNQRLDQLLIGYFLGSTNLGYYSVARRIFQVSVELLVNAPAKVAMPAFSRLQSDYFRLRNVHIRAVQSTTFFTFPAFFTIIVVAPLLLNVLFGAQWSNSAAILQFLSIAGIFYGINFFTTPALLSTGRGRIAFYLHTLNSIGNVVAFFIAVNWGIVAVAASFAVRAIIMQPVSLFTLNKAFGLSPLNLFVSLRASIAAVAIMLIAALLVSSYLSTFQVAPAIELTLTLLACGISYALAQYTLNRSLVTEYLQLIRIIRQ